MEKKTKTAHICYAVLAIIAGIVMLLDALGVYFSGAIDRWYMILLGFASAACLVDALIFKRNAGYIFSMLFLGVFASLSFLQLGYKYYETWYLIPMLSGFGLILYGILSKPKKALLLFSAAIIALSIIMMTSVIKSVWRYALPCVIIASALCAIACIAVYKKKSKSLSDDVYYVTPSEDDDSKSE